jgi:N-acetylglutamate synthase-like GNAT family acetyltransferase
MKIRVAVIDDAKKMKELHDRAVLELCQNDYTIQQLESWINKSSIEKYYLRFETQRIFIAEQDGRMLGYVRWYPETNELCSLCVEPEFARQGIATSLMAHAEQDAREQNVHQLWLDASLTAVPFYQTLGWDFVKLSKAGSLDCVRMIKELISKPE